MPALAEPTGAGLEAVGRVALGPVEAVRAAVVEHAPAMLAAAGLLLVLWLVAVVARAVVRRLLGMTRLDAATEKTQVGKLLRAFDPALTLSRALAGLVHLAIVLLGLMSAADLLGLGAVRDALAAALAFVPRLIAVIAVVGVGGWIASAAGRAVGALLRELRSPYAGPLETLAEVALLVVVVAVAVDMLGVDISLLTANLSIVVAALTVTIAFLFAWSMRRPAEEIVANYYLRRMVAPGDRISLGQVEGTIEGFTPIGVIVRDARGEERFVPARSVLDGLACTGRARRPARTDEPR